MYYLHGQYVNPYSSRYLFYNQDRKGEVYHNAHTSFSTSLRHENEQHLGFFSINITKDFILVLNLLI